VTFCFCARERPLTWHADIRPIAEDALVPRLSHALVVVVIPNTPVVLPSRARHFRQLSPLCFGNSTPQGKQLELLSHTPTAV